MKTPFVLSALIGLLAGVIPCAANPISINFTESSASTLRFTVDWGATVPPSSTILQEVSPDNRYLVSVDNESFTSTFVAIGVYDNATHNFLPIIGPLFISFYVNAIAQPTFSDRGGVRGIESAPLAGTQYGGVFGVTGINTTVPDSGTSAVLFGLALVGLVAIRRRFTGVASP